MSNTTVKSQASTIANSVSQEVGLDPILIASLLELVLPLLMNLPCFRDKNPVEMKTAVTKHPNLMRIMTANMIRNRSKVSMSGKQAFLIADAVLEQLVSASDDEVRAFSAAAKGN